MFVNSLAEVIENQVLMVILNVAAISPSPGIFPPFCHLPVLLGHVLSPNPVSKKTGSISGEQGLKTFPEMDVDEVRARIDAAISQALGLPDFSILRRLLAQEPVVCLRRL